MITALGGNSCSVIIIAHVLSFCESKHLRAPFEGSIKFLHQTLNATDDIFHLKNGQNNKSLTRLKHVTYSYDLQLI